MRLTPRAAADRMEGLESLGDAVFLKARVRAVPEKGRANAALERLIADALQVPPSAVAVERGAKSRLKSVGVAGDAADLEARLMAAAGQVRHGETGKGGRRG